MKLLALTVVLSALQAVDARDPACHPPAPSCRYVSFWTARECNAMIHSRHVRLSTCEAPQGTVIKTTTVTRHPTITHTKTVKPATSTKTSTRIITVTNPATRQETITAWATLTAVTTTTAVESDFETVTITVPFVETDTFSTTVTTTQDSTSALSWAPETCSQGPPPTLTLAPTFKRSENHHENELPRDCSCFLTSTKSCGPRVTKVVTRTKDDRPRTITKTITDRNCKTVTSTKTSTTHVNGAPPPKQTVTLTTTSTSTTTATSTSTGEQIAIVTAATTTTVTDATTITTTGSLVIQTENPCDVANIDKYIVQGTLDTSRVFVGFRGDGFGDRSNCCSNCLGRPDCVFWMLSGDGTICYNYYTNRNAAVEGCTSDLCTRGHPVININPASDGNTYGMSSCGNFQEVF